MTWVTWRQHRIEGAIIVIVVLLLVILLLVTGPGVAAAYRQAGMPAYEHGGQATCAATIADPCWFAKYQFVLSAIDLTASSYIPFLFFLPVLFGMFLGAPLVAHELEQGTHQLAWTQSITSRRWVLVKVGWLLGGIVLPFLLLSVLYGWWRGPITTATGPWGLWFAESSKTANSGYGYDGRGFDVQGLVPFAYALFAFMLGVATGTMVRKAVPAMAITLVVFVLVRVLIEVLLRPSYLPPAVTTWAYEPKNPPPIVQTGRVLSTDTVDAQGNELSLAAISQICPPQKGGGGTPDLFACGRAHGLRSRAFFQPADRFWLFQEIEGVLFLLLTFGLLLLTLWWNRHRIA
jgi:hypothetical protein